MNTMTAEAAGETGGETEGGPMWGRFFDSIGHDDAESVISGSHLPSEFRDTSFSSHIQQSPHSEVHPNDSASVVDHEDPASVLDGLRMKGVPSITGASVPAVDDGTYVFKFRTPSGNTHRFQARHDNVENLRDIVSGKLSVDPFFANFRPENEDDPIPDPLDFQLAYTDADGDTVLMTSDNDVSDSVKNARQTHADRVVIIIQGGKGWAEAGAGKSEAKAQEASAKAAKEIREVEKQESTPVGGGNVPLPEGVAYSAPTPAHVIPQDEIFGIPRDMVLPASIGALAVVILSVFTISRLTRD